MLDQQKNQEVLYYATYCFNQPKEENFDWQQIGLFVLNKANSNTGAIPANLFL